MTDWAAIAALAAGWDDGGLWDDVMAVSALAWAAPAQERRMEWHHLVLAVGNFKRQRGRRLRPAPLANPTGADPTAFFEYPLASSRARVQRDDDASWHELERNLRGAATATTTTLLAALWPSEHLILDWRVLAALIGLQHANANIQASTFTVPASGMAASLDHYPWARAICLNAASEAGCSVRDLERGLYKLSQRVGSEKTRTWEEYGRELQVSLRRGDGASAGEDGAEET